MLTTVPKFRLEESTLGNDRYQVLQETWQLLHNQLHTEDGTLLISSVEQVIATGEILTTPWVGFIHDISDLNHPNVIDLKHLITHPSWQKSSPHCQGLFTFDHELKERLLDYGVKVPVVYLKADLSPQSFLEQLQNSSIYRSLPKPSSCPQRFQSFDVSVVICSYKRVENMAPLLERFVQQQFQGSFEILLWNNNINERERIDTIVAKFQDKLNIKLIHSSENFYCIIRLALAHLMRSDLMLICDDDVLPSDQYIATFMNKWQEYGPEAVLCCRGHVFRPHILDEEHPEKFWTDYEFMTFFDETVDDREIHFLHADNCLISKQLLKQASSYDLGPYDNILIDDYWLSFVLCHHLKIPIWKIKADHIIEMTASAEDPSVALYHNPLVMDQRINFYIEHMRAGWPPGDTLPTTTVTPTAYSEAPLTPQQIWLQGFQGMNMFSEAQRIDFEAAAQYGMKVIRLGACGDTQDFRYLLDKEGAQGVLTPENIQRLKRSIRKAETCGLSVILSFANIPGRIFRGKSYDLRLWKDQTIQQEAIRFWGQIAAELQDCPNLIAYDPLNEPCLPDETELSFDDDMGTDWSPMLNQFYRDVVAAIRQVDTERIIVLESSYWGSPLTMAYLQPIPDPAIAYSFHIYAPRIFTNRAQNRGMFCYPGMMPFHRVKRYADCEYWDRNRLAELLSPVADWQQKHGIPSSQILVGEFGLHREARGATRYLQDLISIFNEHGWSWTAYAFREEAWDAMDYELGDDFSNMLNRSSNPLFEVLSQHFG
ncbi:MAG: cellulase family glycosylhydrolase [Symploca sp. SIO3E6]|nr:cellulase family glycosylhydrolase [Caldora sp. SIO3E6]